VAEASFTGRPSMMDSRIAAGLIATLLVQQPLFHVDTRLVVVQATVRNTRGELVTNLERDAFTVYENGKRQPIMLFGQEDVPVSIGLLIDNSGSMRSLRAQVEAAALAFARASNPRDEMFVLNFADRSHLDVPFTSDVHVLEAGIARVDSIGGTAMWDAVEAAEAYVEGGSHDRKVLVVITDGGDNASLSTADRVRRLAERGNVVIDAIGLFSHTAAAKGARHDLDQLTERTGGIAHYPTDIDQIDRAALDLAEQIRRQYTIGYAPTNQALDGTYRAIKVTVAANERMVVRTRPGYRASPP
jgi:Ca-activated chloride channel homolog